MEQAERPTADQEFESSVLSDARMAARMRLVLAAAAMLVASMDAGFSGGLGYAARCAFAGYLLYSAVVCILPKWAPTALGGRLPHWLDIAWFGIIISLTDGAQSLYFLFYFFAILCAAFRWGYEEGARVAMASVASFTAGAVLTGEHGDAAQLLMRVAFLLALGHMIVAWGGSKLALQRRLALLREVCRMSNPRFGAAATLDRLLQRTLNFYRARHALLLMQDAAGGAWTLRSLASDANGPVEIDLLNEAAFARWRSLFPSQPTLMKRRAWSFWQRSCISHDPLQGRWVRCDADVAQRCAALSDLLEAGSFICAPLPRQCAPGFILVGAPPGRFRRSDALFLEHLAGQVMPMVLNIDALDRLASKAAANERLRLALNLHDSAIQPYIGLKLGLAALRGKASAGKPLRDDIDSLVQMCEQVIVDLRRHAGAVRQGVDTPAPTRSIAPQLREQAEQVGRQWGVDIKTEVDESLRLSERLGAAVLQLVREGIHNIGKHAHSPKGRVRVQYAGERIQVHIENEGSPPAAFRPASITERAAALGGTTQVQSGEQGKTSVLVQIPW